MSNNWGTPVDAQSYFRQQEKRLQRVERRTVQPLTDTLGPGIASQAIQVIDWNSLDTTSNGFYYTQPGAQNAPDVALSWTGSVIAKDDGTGMQQVWNTDGPETLYWMRTYAPTGDGNVTFTDWKRFASGSGYVDNTVLHPQVVSDIQQALTDSADAMNYATGSNSTFRQPDAPTSTPDYTLRVNDTWYDTDDNNHIYVWDGTTWVDAADARIAEALADAAAAQDAAQQAVTDSAAAMDYAETRNKTYRQAAMPTGGTYSLGDVWFDTDDGNHIYVYDGTTFVDAKDAGIAAAQATAAQAQTDAQNAVTAAANAQTTANSAASTASSAQTAANTAQTAANNANTLAQSKNTVYRQTAMPTGGTYRLGDTWFDTDDGNRVYVYDGSTFVDARDTTIATAQAAATAAQTAATNAQTAANNAQTTANNAQTSANGKNTITWSAAAPTTQANTAGDTWFVTSGGLITQQWQGTGGTSWSQKTLDNAVIANLDAGKLTAGTVAAARIGAGTIDVTKLNVTIGGGNMVSNSSFEVDSDNSGLADAWGTYATIPANATYVRTAGVDPNVGFGQKITASTLAPGERAGMVQNLRVTPINGKVTVSGYVKATLLAGHAIRVYVDYYNSAGANVGSDSYYPTGVTAGSFTRWSFTTTGISSAAVSANLYVWIEGQSATGSSNATFDNIQLEGGDVATAYAPKTDEILPGTIVTSMLQATAIDGMTVTGALLQTVATASRGVKMTSSGLTAYNGAGVQTLNIDGTTGTVTIVGSLNAGSSVNGAVVTGGTIQTETTAARGIKLSSTGLNAYNASGVATLTVSAMDGAVSMLGALQSGSTVTGATVTGGTIQTTATPTAGVKIGSTGLTAYNSSNTAVTTIDATTGVITTTGGVLTGGSVTGATLQTTASAARGIKMDSTQLIGYDGGGVAKFALNASTGALSLAGAVTSGSTIDGATMTAGTVQTEATAARGIKINSSGLTGYDSGGTPTFTLTTAGALSMTGPVTTGGTVTGATLQTSGAGAGAIRMTASALTAYDAGGTPSFTITAATGAVSMKGSLTSGSAIDGATVTGGTLQTESTANRGIKINSSGLTAYDAFNNPTFTITAATGAVSMKGDLTSGSTVTSALFKTASSGKRIEMNSTVSNSWINFITGAAGEYLPGSFAQNNSGIVGDGNASSQYISMNSPSYSAYPSNRAYVNLWTFSGGTTSATLGSVNGTAQVLSGGGSNVVLSTNGSVGVIEAQADLRVNDPNMLYTSNIGSSPGGDGQVNFYAPVDMQSRGIAGVGGSGFDVIAGGMRVNGVVQMSDCFKAGTRTQNISTLGTRYTQNITFGAAFPSGAAVPTVTCSPVVTGAEQVFASASSITRSGFTMTIVRTAGALGSVDINWMASAIP